MHVSLEEYGHVVPEQHARLCDWRVCDLCIVGCNRGTDCGFVYTDLILSFVAGARKTTTVQ